MPEQELSRLAVTQSLPLIKAVLANIDIQLADIQNIDEYNRFIITGPEQEKILHSYELEVIMNQWLKGSSFKFIFQYFEKPDEKTSWKELRHILTSKLSEYLNSDPIIVLEMFRGKITRSMPHAQLSHDFYEDGNKIKIIQSMPRDGSFLKLAKIKDLVPSKSDKSLTNDIGSINAILENKLQLPSEKNFIDSHKGTGYRINSIYNLVIVG